MDRKDLCFLSACELLSLMRSGECSAEEIMRAHLAQIDEVNPRVNAIVTLVSEQAVNQARTLDQQPKNERFSNILSGLPIAHKDLTLTKGIRTTFGSPIYKDHIPTQNALIVDRLQAAGAITVGKTNTPEFGAGSQTFNTVFGKTVNPYDETKTCGGSSGGAAVALATGMVPIADGSDLGGSLRNPASFCNVVGLRPSAGRVPSIPTQSAWFPLSVVGPMARTVKDVALMLSAIAGPDPRCPISITDSPEKFGAALDRNFKNVKIAWSPTLGGLPVDNEVRKIIDGQRKHLETLGCTVAEADPALEDADEVFHVLRAWNMELNFGQLLEQYPDQFKDTLIWNIRQGIDLTGPQIGVAERKRTVLFDQLNRFMNEYEFIIAPVVQVLPFDINLPYIDEINGEKLDNYIDWMKSCYRVSATGHPAISIPCGFSRDGLPVGLQIIGRYRDDFGVLQLAHAFEQITECWKVRPKIVEEI